MYVAEHSLRDKQTVRSNTLARFALDAPVLPLVADTLPLAEQARRSLLARCRDLAGRGNPNGAEAEIGSVAPAFWGKDELGRPRVGHPHAFFLPADEDGDGRLDHFTVVAAQGFTADEVRALDRLRQLPRGEGEPLRLLLVGLGTEADLRSPLLAESATWVSATPFVATRYPKRRGRKRDQPEVCATPRDFAAHVLRQELERLRARRPDLPPVVAVELLDGIGPRRLRPIQFQRFRRKPSDGGRRPAAGCRIRFAHPVHGPLVLGHSAHYGLGLFVPEPPPG
jgi:CRISPR-associated protein Csb2